MSFCLNGKYKFLGKVSGIAEIQKFSEELFLEGCGKVINGKYFLANTLFYRAYKIETFEQARIKFSR